MKRPLLACAAGVVAGIPLAGQSVPVLFACLVFLMLGTALLLVRRQISCIGKVCLAGFLLCLLLGFLRQEWMLADMHYRFACWQDRSVTLTGHLVDDPQRTDAGWTLTVQVAMITESGPEIPPKEEEHSPGGRVRASLYEPDLAMGLRYGDRIRVRGTLRVPERQRNPGGFDTSLYLAARGITGQMTLSEPPEQLPGKSGNPWIGLGLSWRSAAVGKLEAMLPSQEAAVLSGMLLGDTDALDPELSDAFRAAGLSHIMAVSGANVAFILMPLMWLLRHLGVNRRRSGACAIPLLLLYVLMTGFDASIVRAACMAILMLAGHVLWRKTDLAASLAGAMTLMLLCNSAWLFDVGFLLSFLATGAIGLFCEPLARKLPAWMPKGVREVVSATLSAQAGVLPVQIISFHVLNPYAIPINLIVVPMTGLLTLGGAVLLISEFLFPGAAWLPAKGMEGLLRLLCGLVTWTSEWPMAELPVATPEWLLWVLYPGWLLLIRFGRQMLERDVWRRLLTAALLFSLLTGFVGLRPRPLLRITVADVGQGEAILIQTPMGASLLVDGGGSPADATGNRIGERVLLPLLRQSGILRPDVILSTHPHIDHVQGLRTVAREAGAGEVILPAGMAGYDEPGGLLEIATSRNIPIRSVVSGDVVWEEPSMTLTVLSAGGCDTVREEDANEASMVLLLQYRAFSMLLTADTGEPTEAELVHAGKLTAVDVLKVGHHGSGSATTEAFLDVIQPVAAVVSVGRNRYGHPVPAVLQRLAEHHAGVHVTRQCGAWKLRTNGLDWQATAHVQAVRTLFAHAFQGGG